MLSFLLSWRIFRKPVRVGQRTGSQRGSVMLEAGLTLPLLVLMACGAMDFARIFVAGIIVESSARAGVQSGSFDLGQAELSKMNDAAAKDGSSQGLTGVSVTSRTFCRCLSGGSEVNCADATCSGEVPNGYVETTASYTFNPIVPYPGIPRNITVASSACFRAQ
jgi:hypothetical protein